MRSFDLEDPKQWTEFQRERGRYAPRFPESLQDLTRLRISTGKILEPKATAEGKAHIKQTFAKTWGKPNLHFTKVENAAAASVDAPAKVGVVLSGGPAPGGHNVICGLFDGLKSLRDDAQLIGFVGGAGGILKNEYRFLDADVIATFRNTGGFHMIGTGRSKIESEMDLERCAKVVADLDLDALVIIGGDDSNTNVALIAEYLANKGANCTVIGVPKTIDGDLRNDFVEISFGFDTAVRVYSELVSHIARDAVSAGKYYHFVRLMGRSASHITLETALQTQPTLALIAEEAALHGQTLRDIVQNVASVIVERAEQGIDHGVILVPEGLIEFIPEMRELISELNHILAEHRAYLDTLHGFTAQIEYLSQKLSKDGLYTMSSLPIDIQRQLIMDRDPHGNVVVSLIETERLLIELLQTQLGEMKAEGKYKGKFGYQRHFLGYEGRCAAPTNFDADYAYALGRTAVALLTQRATGYMSVVQNLAKDRDQWQASGIPIVSMMHLERRHGKDKAVLRKALVDLYSPAFAEFVRARPEWAKRDCFRFTGPIQYFGPQTLTERAPVTLQLGSMSTDPRGF